MTVLTRVTVPPIMQLSVGDTVQLSLEAQTGAGYLWTVNADLGGHVEVAHSYSPGIGIGSPSQQLISLTARAEGTDRLRFDYRRPWEAPHVDDHFVIDIRVAS
jgi:predicted secreted protein